MMTAPRRARIRARRPGSRRLALALATVGTMLVLAGCSAGSPGPGTTGSAGPVTPPTVSSTSGEQGAGNATGDQGGSGKNDSGKGGSGQKGGDTSATPTPTPTPPATPVTLACSSVITDTQLYAYNPNVSAISGFTPSADLVRQAAAQKGRTCGWVNQTSGEKIEFGVARPAAPVLTDLKDQAASIGTATPAYGNYPKVEGYFARVGKTGRVEVFTGGYWIVGSSTVFFEPGDAAQLVQDIMQNLKVG